MENYQNIRLTRDTNFLDIERLIGLLPEGGQDGLKLQIPNSLAFAGGFGMEGAALQLLATTLRRCSSLIVHTAAADPTNAEDFEDLCNHCFGLCCLRLADTILSSKKKNVEMAVALAPASPIFSALRSGDFKSSFKGMYLAIPSIKAPVPGGGKDKELNNPLYNNDKVVNAERFLEITKQALGVVYPQLKVDDVHKQFVGHISELLRELYTNTHRHARTDVSGNPYKKNFRSIIFKQAELSDDRLQEINKSGGGDLAMFVANWLSNSTQKLRLLDITVVDSGPGFARRWTGLDKEDLSLDNEIDAVINCFTKHGSTESTDSSGTGLNNVLMHIKSLQGWMRLRTGRTSIERSFYSDNDVSVITKKHINAEVQFVEGTVFNIVVPISKLKGM